MSSANRRDSTDAAIKLPWIRDILFQRFDYKILSSTGRHASDVRLCIMQNYDLELVYLQLLCYRISELCQLRQTPANFHFPFDWNSHSCIWIVKGSFQVTGTTGNRHYFTGIYTRSVSHTWMTNHNKFPCELLSYVTALLINDRQQSSQNWNRWQRNNVNYIAKVENVTSSCSIDDEFKAVHPVMSFPLILQPKVYCSMCWRVQHHLLCGNLSNESDVSCLS